MYHRFPSLLEEPEYIGGQFMLGPALRALDYVAGTPGPILEMLPVNLQINTALARD
jgi:hypothetical protein